MELPFEHIEEHEIFEGTFLNEVSFKMFLPNNSNRVEFDKVKTFFIDMFNIEFTEPMYSRFLDSRLKVRNKEGGIQYDISPKAIKITIEQNRYSDFQRSLLPRINEIVKAYSLWFDYCDKIELKYVDLWPLLQKADTSVMEALKTALFSTELRNNAIRQDDNFNYWQVEDKDGTYLSLKYGYYLTESQKDNQGMALESRCGHTCDTGIKVSEIAGLSTRFNETLYDAFMWAVTNDVINAMRKPKIPHP